MAAGRLSPAERPARAPLRAAPAPRDSRHKLHVVGDVRVRDENRQRPRLGEKAHFGHGLDYGVQDLVLKRAEHERLVRHLVAHEAAGRARRRAGGQKRAPVAGAAQARRAPPGCGARTRSTQAGSAAGDAPRERVDAALGNVLILDDRPAAGTRQHSDNKARVVHGLRSGRGREMRGLAWAADTARARAHGHSARARSRTGGRRTVPSTCAASCMRTCSRKFGPRNIGCTLKIAVRSCWKKTIARRGESSASTGACEWVLASCGRLRHALTMRRSKQKRSVGAEQVTDNSRHARRAFG